MNALVGYTGFVGGNLYETGEFDAAYNSKNIAQAYGTRPDLLVYAGVRAEKYLANQSPQKDRDLILQAEENIERIAPRRLVLISTIDVFKTPKGVDEASPIDTEGLHPYGYHRYLLEQWVRERFEDACVVRLPGLFGKGIKKNFIYDYIHRIPFMLKQEKLDELEMRSPGLKSFYEMQENGFCKVRELSLEEQGILRGHFEEAGFSALNFTDSRSVYQFYDLGRLWSDIQTVLRAGVRLWHAATEPISAGELYQFLTGEAFSNELGAQPADYDFRTRHAAQFGGKDGYICQKGEVADAISAFVGREEKR